MKERHFIFYGWFIVAVGILAHMLGYGSRYSFSVIFPFLLEEFHWPRDTTALMLSVHMLAYGLVAPVAGLLVDGMGPRKTMCFGIALLALGLGLSGQASQPWHFFITFGLLCGSGLCLSGTVAFACVIRNWFERRRGLAFSLVISGTGLGLFSYPAIAFLIDRFGWRFNFLIEAAIVAAVMLPLIALFIRYHPSEKGLRADGSEVSSRISPSTGNEWAQITDQAWAAVSWTLPKALGTRRFWMLCLSTFSLWGIMQHVMVAHHVAFAVDVGYTKIHASAVLSSFGILFSCGSFSGLISDRIGREITMTVGTIVGISGIFVLMMIENTPRPWMLYYYAMALGYGLGMTCPTVAAATTDIFQGPKVGAVIGSIWFCFAVGGAIGPWLGGWIFELSGSYMIAFVVAVTFYAVACAAIWSAAPRKVRVVPGRVHTRNA